MTNQTQSLLIGPLSLNSAHSLISTMTMSAPSPDWFSGFYNFNVVEETSGAWYDSFVIETYPWDAGTDSGSTYLADDMPIDPALWIYQLTPENLPSSDAFLDPEGVTVLPVATWSCSVVAVPPDDDELTSGVMPISLSRAFRIASFALMMLYSLL